MYATTDNMSIVNRTMFRFHVTCDVEKKILATDDKAALPSAIVDEFGIDSDSSFTVQSWDAEFEDWVDVTDVTQLPDKCKLQVIVKGGHDQF